MKGFKRVKFFSLVCSLIILCFGITGCGGTGEQNSSNNTAKDTLTFADPGWDSIHFHNAVAQFIIENGYGYKTDVIPGSTPTTFLGLRNGDIDIYMEVWKENLLPDYDEAIANGEIVEVSINFDDNKQGLYVPTYVIEGDPARGIEPMAPGLKRVQDLPEYWELFKDPEDPSKGRIYGAIPGWAADRILYGKYQTYGLDKTYNYFQPGSDTALAAAIAKAVEEGKPFVGYYWEPTWISGKYDLTLLEEDEYSDEKWNNGYACTWPSNDVTVAVYKDIPEQAPEVVEFLQHYRTSSQLTAEALAYMQDNEATPEEAARWFLKEHEQLWTAWVPDEIAEKVKNNLD